VEGIYPQLANLERSVVCWASIASLQFFVLDNSRMVACNFLRL
jgi:hypothetical protein